MPGVGSDEVGRWSWSGVPRRQTGGNHNTIPSGPTAAEQEAKDKPMLPKW
jgi:hypothetical protein